MSKFWPYFHIQPDWENRCTERLGCMAQKRKHWDLNPGCSTPEVLLKGGVQFQGSVWLCPKPQVLPPSIPLLIKEGGKKGENDSLCSQVRGPAGSSSWKVGQGQEELSAVEAAPTKGPACRCTACSPQPLSSITCLFPRLLQRSGALTALFLTTPSFFPPRQDLRMLPPPQPQTFFFQIQVTCDFHILFLLHFLSGHISLWWTIFICHHYYLFYKIHCSSFSILFILPSLKLFFWYKCHLLTRLLQLHPKLGIPVGIQLVTMVFELTLYMPHMWQMKG